MGSLVILGGRPGDDVSAVVCARASGLVGVELERLNLQQKVCEEGRGEKRVEEDRERENRSR